MRVVKKDGTIEEYQEQKSLMLAIKLQEEQWLN